MIKYIAAVSYRRAWTAYLKVIGRTPKEAERFAKRVGTALRDQLPKEAEVGVPRHKGVADGFETYEIPVLIGECESAARSALARLVLQGSV